MDYEFIPPPLPTLARWRNLYKRFGRVSVLRAMEYETVATLPLSGRVLDVGGGRKALYQKYLDAGLEIDSVNIDPAIEPTYLIEPGDPLPIDDATYDCAICLNTLEHVYDPRAVLAEIFRVLKPGGTVYITVPWVFRIHAHPDDFTRASPSWWRETARQIGFSRMELKPLVWGRYTTGGMITGYRGIWPRGQFHLAHLKDWLYARVSFAGQDTYAGRRGARICNASPGWFISATR